jgi:hypothetical protein
VKQSIAFGILLNKNFNNECEVIALKTNETIFLFAYLRNGKKNTGISKLLELVLLYYQLSPKIIVLGDLNARMRSLGNSSSNTAGTALQNFMDSYETFQILNTPCDFTFEKHFMDPSRNSVLSLIDLCLVSSSSSADVTDLEVLRSPHSDHYPVMISHSIQKKQSVYVKSEYEQLYALRSQNLHYLKRLPSQFRTVLQEQLETRIIYPLGLDSGSLWKHIEKSIYEALKKSKLLRKSSRNPYFKPLPDHIWSLRLTNRALFKKELYEFRSQQWKAFIDSMNSDMDVSSVWRKFNRSLGRTQAKLKYGDPSIEVEHIRLLFEENSRLSIPRSHRCSELNFAAEDIYGVNHMFSLQELFTALDHIGNSAPGPDGIPFNILKEFRSLSSHYLLALVNRLFLNGYIPTQMKACLQVALPKSQPGDFRPITLMNCILKLFEKMLYNRIEPIIDSVLPKEQFGFRKYRSSSDQAAHLIMDLQSTRTKKHACGIVFVDIKKAFDRIDREILLSDLNDFGFTGPTLLALRNLLNDNFYRIILEGYISSEYTTQAGCPQGSILSPLLWNFYFRDLTKVISSSSSFIFADDLALKNSHQNSRTMISQLQTDFSKFLEWCYSKRIEVSTSKTKFMDVSSSARRKRHATSDRDMVFRYRNPLTNRTEKLDSVTHYRYLGVIIDENLSFRPYVETVSHEITRRTNLISRIAKTVRLSRENIERFYQGYVRGYIQYGSAIWGCLTEKVMEPIINADRRGLRTCVGALLRTPTMELEKEITLETLPNIIVRSILKKGAKIINHPVLSSLRDSIYDLSSYSDLARKWIEIWSHFELPRAPDIANCYSIITIRLPKKKKEKHKYWKDFWKERTLARIRMGVLPTRSWAKSMNLATDNLCRHCQQSEETLDHLFNQCSHLNYLLLESFQRSVENLSCFRLSFNVIRNILLSTEKVLRRNLENALLEFIKSNDLFKRM